MPIVGTNLLHDTTGKTWLSLSGDELERTHTWDIEQLLGIPREESDAFLEGARVLWAVGDGNGPRYASIEGGGGLCEPSTVSHFVQQHGAGWRVIDEPVRDRSPPTALPGGALDQGLVYASVTGSCGHGGPPFSYDLHTRTVPNAWPKPQRVTVPFMGGKQAFTIVAFSTYALLPSGDVVVLGGHRKLDARGELSTEGWALEVFRKGAKKTELISVDSGEEGLPDDPIRFAAAAHRIIAAHGPGGGRFDSFTYQYNGWWSESGEALDDAVWSQRAEEELFVNGVPFFIERRFLHAGAHFLVGKAEQLDVAFVERRVHWKP